MSVSYCLVCVDTGEAIDLGKFVTSSLAGVKPDFYIPTVFASLVSGHELSEEDRVSMALLGIFLLRHRGRELRVVTEDYLQKFDGYLYDTAMSCAELSEYLADKGQIAPNPESDTTSVDVSVGSRLAKVLT